MNSFNIHSVEEVPQAAVWLLEQITDHRVIAFYGNMGAGKTTLIKELCSLLHCEVMATSPTFAIINEYPTPVLGSVFHFDFYRINHPKELVEIGLEEYLYSGSYCFIEWPEIAEDLFPSRFLNVELLVTGKNSREIRILAHA